MTQANLILEFLGMAGLLSLLAVSYGHLRRALGWDGRGREVLGVLFGLTAVYCMFSSIEVAAGVIVDMRNLPLALAAAFLGRRGLIPALMIAAGVRLAIGGAGAEAGVVGMAIAGLMGLWWRQITRGPEPRGLLALGMLGGMMSAHLAAVVLLPRGIAEQVLLGAGPAMVMVNLFGALFVGALLERERQMYLRESMLTASAVIDPVSGLYNDVGFQREFKRLREVVQTSRGQATILIRLEDLGWLERTFGGESVAAAAAALRPRLNAVLGANDIAGRHGTDGIVIFMPDQSLAEASAKTEALSNVLTAEHYQLPGAAKVRLRSSLGASWSAESEDLSEAVARAERALAQSRRAGPGRVQLLQSQSALSSARAQLYSVGPGAQPA